MRNKYELTDETKDINGITLHRIRALRDIPSVGVKSGDLGGWIEKESKSLGKEPEMEKCKCEICGKEYEPQQLHEELCATCEWQMQEESWEVQDDEQ